MDRLPNELPAVERARWLAELAEAIDQAQRLAWRLGIVDGNSADAKALYARLELARLEVDSLRRGGWPREQTDIPPQWINCLSGVLNLIGPAEAVQTPCGRLPPPANS